MNVLKVGDPVLWYPGFGNQGPRESVVTRIELVEVPGEDRGKSVDAVEWETAKKHAIVDLDNGKWAWGYQLEPIPEPEPMIELPE